MRLPFSVGTSHNFREGQFRAHGQFATEQEAVAKAKEIVDACLHRRYKPGMDAEQLLSTFICFGETPMVHGPVTVAFSALHYAKRRAEEITRAAQADAAAAGEKIH